MTYSVIIPSLYEADGKYLKLCVTSLRESGFQGQIIVVTNGSKYQPKLPFGGVSVHLHTRDQGQCRATNIGAQVATGDYLMVSNSDMYYAPGWDKHLRFDYPVFSPNLVEPTNNHGSADPFLKVDGGFTIDEFNKQAVDEEIKTIIKLHEAEGTKLSEPGFNLPFFIKRDLWDLLEGYDIGFDPWGSNSDTDLQTRINEAGVTPMRLRDVLVYHFSNKTDTFKPENDAFRMHNFEYFKEKHGFDRDELGSDVWYNKDMLPKDKERIKYDQKPYLS